MRKEARPGWIRAGTLRRPARRSLGLECLEARNLWSVAPPATAALLPFTPFETAHVAGFLADPNQIDLYRLAALPKGERVSVAVHTRLPGRPQPDRSVPPDPG
jgi:hypothetical protein